MRYFRSEDAKWYCRLRAAVALEREEAEHLTKLGREADPKLTLDDILRACLTHGLTDLENGGELFESLFGRPADEKEDSEANDVR